MKDIKEKEGTGAAGGIGGMLSMVLGGELRSGIETFLDLISFDEALKGSDLVITGEGRLDSQSLNGKLISGVIRRSRPYHLPVALIVGQSIVDPKELTLEKAIILETSRYASSLEDSFQNAKTYYRKALDEAYRFAIKSCVI